MFKRNQRATSTVHFVGNYATQTYGVATTSTTSPSLATSADEATPSWESPIWSASESDFLLVSNRVRSWVTWDEVLYVHVWTVSSPHSRTLLAFLRNSVWDYWNSRTFGTFCRPKLHRLCRAAKETVISRWEYQQKSRSESGFLMKGYLFTQHAKRGFLCDLVLNGIPTDDFRTPEISK